MLWPFQVCTFVADTLAALWWKYVEVDGSCLFSICPGDAHFEDTGFFVCEGALARREGLSPSLLPPHQTCLPVCFVINYLMPISLLKNDQILNHTALFSDTSLYYFNTCNLCELEFKLRASHHCNNTPCRCHGMSAFPSLLVHGVLYQCGFCMMVYWIVATHKERASSNESRVTVCIVFINAIWRSPSWSCCTSTLQWWCVVWVSKPHQKCFVICTSYGTHCTKILQIRFVHCALENMLEKVAIIVNFICY